MFTLTDAIRQVEQALARGEALPDVVKWVSREFSIEPSLLTRRWVQFTPSTGPARRPGIDGMQVTPGSTGLSGRFVGK
jgi:hypothetical protein